MKSEDIIGLTGTKNEIDKVAEDWGVYYQKEILDGEEDYTMNHLDIIFLANANGEFIDYFPPKIQSVLIVEKIRNIINRCTNHQRYKVITKSTEK